MRTSLVLAGLALGVACKPKEGLLLLAAEQNYAFDSSLAVTSQTIASGVDARVDWSDLTQDQLGKEIALSEVDQLIIVRFEDLAQQEVLAKASVDCLQQKDITGVVEFFPAEDQSSAQLSDFQLIGYNVDPAEQFQEGMGTFLLSAYTEGVPGVRMLTFVEPQATSESEEILLTSDSATVTYSVDLSVGERIPLNTTSLDWADLEVPTDCGSFPINKYDWLMIARYSDQELKTLEEDFLRVDELADELWNADIEGRSTIDLLGLTSESGNAFDGFDQESTWLVALRCSTCSNPAPPFLALVERE